MMWEFCIFVQVFYRTARDQQQQYNLSTVKFVIFRDYYFAVTKIDIM